MNRQTPTPPPLTINIGEKVLFEVLRECIQGVACLFLVLQGARINDELLVSNRHHLPSVWIVDVCCIANIKNFYIRFLSRGSDERRNNQRQDISEVLSKNFRDVTPVSYQGC